MEQQQIINLDRDVAELHQEDESRLEDAIYGQYQQELTVGKIENPIIQICVHEFTENSPDCQPTVYYYKQQEGSIYAHYFHQMYDLLQQNLKTQNIDSNALNHMATANPNAFEQTIEMELKRAKENCAIAEENYILQMLAENPIVIERRNNSNNYSSCEQSDNENIDVVTVSDSTKKSKHDLLQRQRTEACRRSRYNDKIKKAKMAYRHQYMAKRLENSIQLFNFIQDIIEQAESYLLDQAFPGDRLKSLRLQCGIDKAIAESHLMIKEINQDSE